MLLAIQKEKCIKNPIEHDPNRMMLYEELILIFSLKRFLTELWVNLFKYFIRSFFFKYRWSIIQVILYGYLFFVK